MDVKTPTAMPSGTPIRSVPRNEATHATKSPVETR